MVATLTVALAGDVMTGRGIDQVLAHPSLPQIHEPWVHDARDYVVLAERANGPIARPLDGAALWGAALLLLRRPDVALRIVNLETAVTTSDEPWPGKGIHYRMDPGNVGVLAAAGIDAAVLANNHVLDWGRAGLADTLHTLRAAGLRTAGAGADEVGAWEPAAWTLPDGSEWLLFACAEPGSGVMRGWEAGPTQPGVALLPDLSDASARALAQRIASTRGRRDARVIVSIHWGDNWVDTIPEAQRRFAHALIDAGAADLVHGHSSHHPLAAEVYLGRLVLYGCGDLVNDYEGIGGSHGDIPLDLGCLYLATLDAADGRLQRLQVVPLRRRRFALEPASGMEQVWLEALYRRTRQTLGSDLVRDGADWVLRWRD